MNRTPREQDPQRAPDRPFELREVVDAEGITVELLVEGEEAEAGCKAVDDAADELCLRVRVCIEGGLDVDELVGVVTGESTP
jgi:hypothetical protein